MKNEILDEPFHETFRDILTKDEKVLWRGNSMSFKDSLYTQNKGGQTNFNLKRLISKLSNAGIELTTGATIAFIYVAIFVFLGNNNAYIYVLGLLIIIVSFVFQFHQISKRTNHYAVTSNRILFQFAGLPKEVHSIPLSDIKNCTVNLHEENHGVIFLKTKNPEKLSDKLFEENRHSPTLEQIENPNQVVKIIRQAIQDNYI